MQNGLRAPFKQFYGAAIVVIGVSTTNKTDLMFEIYWNNCGVITICFGIIDAFSGI
jgi:hypothetical protein